MNLPRVTATAAYVLAELGEASEAAELVRESEDLLAGLAPKGITGWQGPTYQFLGRASLALGRLDEAKRFGERAVQLCSQRLGNAADAHRLLGDIAVHSDPVNVERAEAHYRETRALSEPRAMRSLTAHCHLGLGKLYRRTGRRDEAHEHLTIATTLYEEMDMRYWLEQAEAEVRELA